MMGCSDLINATESASRRTNDQDQLIQKVLVLHRMNSAQIEVFFQNFKGLMESVELNLVKEKPFHFYRTIHAIAGIAQSANLKKLKNIAIQLEQILLSESENASTLVCTMSAMSLTNTMTSSCNISVTSMN